MPDLPSLQAQAASLAYIDTFMVPAVGAAIMFCLAFLEGMTPALAG
jgi:hypothetical protein